MIDTESGEDVLLDADRIVVLLGYADIPAYVEQTGGGTATIYAGTPRWDPTTDFEWHRYPCLAGPGWFDGPGWTKGRFHVDDTCVGPDDDGVSAQDADAFFWSGSLPRVEITEELIAAEIVKVVKRVQATDTWQAMSLHNPFAHSA